VFPYEVVVEIIYLCLLVACVVAVAQHSSVEFRSTKKTFEGIILHPDVKPPIVRTDDFKKHITFACASFYNIDEDALEKFFAPPINDTVPMLVTYMNGTQKLFGLTRTQPLGPFHNLTNVELSSYLLDFAHILITMNFTGAKYGYESHQHWIVTLEYSLDVCLFCFFFFVHVFSIIVDIFRIYFN
jgi:hypothetical protein